MLDSYLSELMKLKVRASAPMTKFLAPRGQECEVSGTPRSLHPSFDCASASNDLFALLDTYEDAPHVKIRLEMPNVFYTLLFPQDGDFEGIIRECKRLTLGGVDTIGYLDETGEQLELRGDMDLGVLLRTYPGEILFKPM